MNIRQLRESKNMTQENVASILGVKRTTVAMWETGKALPRARILVQLASILDCTVDELLENKKTPSRED